MFKGPQVCGAPRVFKGMVWLWAVPMLNHIPASSGSLELLLAIAPNHQRATGRLIRLCPDVALRHRRHRGYGCQCCWRVDTAGQGCRLVHWRTGGDELCAGISPYGGFHGQGMACVRRAH